ncbi:uncharacterized protein TNCV_4384811 [Trichonephila clavipes]|nr:uncharacterized protein TNCV_4384811 [Trichonephila clavipes]
MKIGNNGNLVLGPFDESRPYLMIVLMNCQTKLRINHLTAVKSVAILESNANLNFYTWKKHSLFDISMQYQELSEMQNDESVKTLFNIKGAMAWICNKIETKYPHSTKSVRKLLLPFPSSYLAECGFSAVNDLLSKKRNRLNITKRGDLRLKLTKLENDIKSLCRRHDASGSH